MYIMFLSFLSFFLLNPTIAQRFRNFLFLFTTFGFMYSSLLTLLFFPVYILAYGDFKNPPIPAHLQSSIAPWGFFQPSACCHIRRRSTCVFPFPYPHVGRKSQRERVWRGKKKKKTTSLFKLSCLLPGFNLRFPSFHQG